MKVILVKEDGSKEEFNEFILVGFDREENNVVNVIRNVNYLEMLATLNWLDKELMKKIKCTRFK